MRSTWPTNAGPKPRFVAALVVALVLLVASILALRLLGGIRDAWAGYAAWVGWVLCFICVAYFVMLPFQIMARLRDVRLARERPESYVRGIVNSPATDRAVKALGWAPMPYTMSMRVDETGIEWWGFSFRKPDLIRSVEWSAIGNVTSAAFNSSWALFRGIVLPISGGADPIPVPFAVAQNRSGGATSTSMKDAAGVASELNRYRLARFSRSR